MKPQWSDDVQLVAGILLRHSNPRVGADRRNPDEYAVYFYDDQGHEFRSFGGFTSPGEASRSVVMIQAETVLEALGTHWADLA